MENLFWIIAVLVVAGMAYFFLRMWRQRDLDAPLPNRETDEQRLTEVPMKRPPD